MCRNSVTSLEAENSSVYAGFRLSPLVSQKSALMVIMASGSTGVDRTVVSKIERGVTNPSLDVLLRLANHLDVHVANVDAP